MQDLINFHPTVRRALDGGLPVVALESTLIAHGLPWPDNLETAHALAETVLAQGATPAVIGVCEGCIRIGLDSAELERFARSDGVRKASRRDLPALLALGRDGATTVAGTVACAAMAGIEVFATGGIGGVHRDAETSFDISGDIAELARTRVAVVCSGAKSILDLAKTLESLETEGVPVVGYGTDYFPAFYIRNSGLRLDARVDTPEEAARLIASNKCVGAGGVVIANPIPRADELDAEDLERWIDQALGEAFEHRITGKSVTPFLLERLFELSGGQTLRANKALLHDNAGVAARVAVALAAQQ